VDDVFAFNTDVSFGYDKGLGLDRVDNNKGYCPHNVKWSTCMEQTKNTRKNLDRGIRYRHGAFHVSISVGDKQIHHGTFKTKEIAIKERDLIYGERYGN
jgi:hypothetical protein